MMTKEISDSNISKEQMMNDQSEQLSVIDFTGDHEDMKSINSYIGVSDFLRD